MNKGEWVKGDAPPKPAEPFDIEIESVALPSPSHRQTGGFGQSREGTVQPNGLSIIRKYDSASLALMRLVMDGRPVQVIITLYSDESLASRYLKITMDDAVFASSIFLGANSGGAGSMESLGVLASKLVTEYFGRSQP